LHRYNHGCDTGFHIGGAEAPDLAIVHLGSEDVVLPVLACWHCIQMAAEQERRPLANAAYATDDTRPSSFFVRHHVGKHTGALKTFGHARRHGSFIPGRIDTTNTHKITRQLHQLAVLQVSQGTFLHVHILSSPSQASVPRSSRVWAPCRPAVLSAPHSY